MGTSAPAARAVGGSAAAPENQPRPSGIAPGPHPPGTTQCQRDCGTRGRDGAEPGASLHGAGVCAPPALPAAMKWHRRAQLVAFYCSGYPDFSLWRGAVPLVTVWPAPTVAAPGCRWLGPPGPGAGVGLTPLLAGRGSGGAPGWLPRGGTLAHACRDTGVKPCPPLLPSAVTQLSPHRPGQGGQHGHGGT